MSHRNSDALDLAVHLIGFLVIGGGLSALLLAFTWSMVQPVIN